MKETLTGVCLAIAPYLTRATPAHREVIHMAERPVHIGFAARDITPPPGIPLAGYSARAGVATGALDGIHARAMVAIDPGRDTRLAIVTADLVAFSPETIETFRANVLAATGFTPDDVILAVTHTHSGPAYGALFGFFTPDDVAQEPEASMRWGEALPGVLIDLIAEAAAAAQPARLAFGSTQVALSTHRRLRDPLGEIRLAPNPDGVTDPVVSVMHARTADGDTPIGTLVNYACHPVVLCEDNLEYSGDFPTYLVDALETGGGAAIFVNGTCGDINPKRRGSASAAREQGEEIARSVAALLPTLTPEPMVDIVHAVEDVDLPLRFPPPEALRAYVDVAEAALAAHGDPSDFEGRRLTAEVGRARRMEDRLGRRRERLGARITADTLRVRLQVARIGPALFVAMPGEAFAPFGLRLRDEADGEHVFVLGYTNESIGYVPTIAAYEEGGYEVVSSQLAPGAGEHLTQAALTALGRLAPLKGVGG